MAFEKNPSPFPITRVVKASQFHWRLVRTKDTNLVNVILKLTPVSTITLSYVMVDFRKCCAFWGIPYLYLPVDAEIGCFCTDWCCANHCTWQQRLLLHESNKKGIPRNLSTLIARFVVLCEFGLQLTLLACGQRHAQADRTCMTTH